MLLNDVGVLGYNFLVEIAFLLLIISHRIRGVFLLCDILFYYCMIVGETVSRDTYFYVSKNLDLLTPQTIVY